MYAWNLFRLAAMDSALITKMLKVVRSEVLLLEESKGWLLPSSSFAPSFSPLPLSFPPLPLDQTPCYADDYVVVTLMHGACLKALKCYDEAEQCFKMILEKCVC